MFVHHAVDDSAPDDDGVAGELTHPAVLAVWEHLGEAGCALVDEIRQVGVLGADGDPVGVDIAVTVSVP